MGLETMGSLLAQCSQAYEKAGPLVKTQVNGFMGPLLRLLGQTLDALEQAKQEREQLAMALTVANDAIKALSGSTVKTCSGGTNATPLECGRHAVKPCGGGCAGHGCQGAGKGG